MASTSSKDFQTIIAEVKKNNEAYLQKHLRPEHTTFVDQHEQTLLHVAAYEGFVNICWLLLQRGFNPNARDKNNWTPLHCAASGGASRQDSDYSHLVILELLLRKGADPNATTSSQATALHYLVRYPYSERLMAIVDAIVRKGGDIDPRDEHGETPLHQVTYNYPLLNLYSELCLFFLFLFFLRGVLVVFGGGRVVVNQFHRNIFDIPFLL